MAGCRILLLGFDGFHRYWPNPAGELALSLSGYRARECVVDARLVPVSLEGVRSLLGEGVLDGYSAVVGLGLDPAAREPRLELVASNVAYYREPRASKAVFEEVIPDGPLALPTGLPYRRLVEECRGRGLPLRVGASVGTYMCGAMAYVLHYWSQTRGRPAGFIHVPPDTSTAMKLGLGRWVPAWLLRETMTCVLDVAASLAG